MVDTATSEDVRRRNRQRVLSMVRREGAASRTEIGIGTGLSAATISTITTELIEENVLIPTRLESSAAAGRGRPQVTLEVNPDGAMVCAVYLQLNRVSATVVDRAGVVLSDFSVDLATQEASVESIKNALINCVNDALRLTNRDSESLHQIAVGVQGVIDVGGSTVLWTPICGVRNIPVRQWLENRFFVPTRVANDCDMIAQSLHWQDPDKYGKNFGTILLAHGVGMGLYLREGIINGTQSSGIEFGHMSYIPRGALCRCGNRGCIEAYAGDYAISRRARGEDDQTPPLDLLESPDMKCIKDAAIAGDADAIAAIETAGAAIGTGIASLYALVDHFPIVLVGRGTILFELMEKSLRANLSSFHRDDNQLPVEIECYPHENPLVLQGCVVSALQAHDQDISNRRVQQRGVT